MALVKCPECGRDNVSDTAEACPNCGYGVKAHFEKVKAEQERLEREKIEEENRKRQEKLDEERRVLEEQRRKELAEIQRLEEEKKRKEREKEEELYKIERARREEKRHHRNKIIAIIVSVMVIITGIIAIIYYVNRTNTINELKNEVQEPFKEDIAKLETKIKVNNENIQLEYTFGKVEYSNNKLTIKCKVQLKDEDLNKYSSVSKNSKESEELYGKLRTIYTILKSNSLFTYDLDNGKSVDIILCESYEENKAVVSATEGSHKYELRYCPNGNDSYYTVSDFNKEVYSSKREKKTSESSSYSTAAPAIEIIDKSYYSSGGYYYATGAVSNNSSRARDYIKVKVTYYDSNKKVLTTDWTYAVDSVPLKPGENKQFKIMTKVSGSVASYKLEIIN